MQINNSQWSQVLAQSFKSDSFQALSVFLREEREAGKVIFPSEKYIFNALELTPLANVKVVILGQDPYHGVGQSHGLSFSVQDGVAIPPSLRNIYKEIAQDVYEGKKIAPSSGCLTHWAEQGVLLLNAVLTVEEAMPNSHKDKGWEDFTDSVIQAINEKSHGVIFLLWGACAKKKAKFVDISKHTVLQSSHPSPLSAYRGFLGSGHFSRANELLLEQNKTMIDWFKE